MRNPNNRQGQTFSPPVLDLDNKAIKIKDCVKYLGDSFNSKGNNSNLIEKRIQDAKLLFQTSWQ